MIFRRGLTHDFGPKNWNFIFLCFLVQIDLEMVIVSFKIERKAFQTRNVLFFQSCRIYNFLKGLTHGFSRKIEIFFFLLFGKNGPRSCVSFVLDRKKGFPDYKNVVFQESPYL